MEELLERIVDWGRTMRLMRTDEGHPTWLVIFEGSRKVDFSLLPLANLRDTIDAGPLPELYDRGYRVLLDKDGLAARLPLTRRVRKPRRPPEMRVTRRTGATRPERVARA